MIEAIRAPLLKSAARIADCLESKGSLPGQRHVAAAAEGLPCGEQASGSWRNRHPSDSEWPFQGPGGSGRGVERGCIHQLGFFW